MSPRCFQKIMSPISLKVVTQCVRTSWNIIHALPTSLIANFELFTSPSSLGWCKVETPYPLVSYNCGTISIWHSPHVMPRSSAAVSLFGHPVITLWFSCTSTNTPSIKDRSPSIRRDDHIITISVITIQNHCGALPSEFTSISSPRRRCL